MNFLWNSIWTSVQLFLEQTRAFDLTETRPHTVSSNVAPYELATPPLALSHTHSRSIDIRFSYLLNLFAYGQLANRFVRQLTRD